MEDDRGGGNSRLLRVRSSLADDAWRGDSASASAYEWWYFDAVSDDARDVLVIIFFDNFVFSPRYNRLTALSDTILHQAAHAEVASPSRATKFPCVAFCLYRDNRLLVRALNEYGAAEFSASVERPRCRIGANSFRFDDASGCYLLQIDTVLRRGRRLTANFRWKVLESDLFSEPKASPEDAPTSVAGDGHEWNMVAPRCRVSGSLKISKRRGSERNLESSFNGTGYHDHNRDSRPLACTLAEWQWGRAHFTDTSAIFYRYRELQQRTPTTRLFIIRNHKLADYTARYTASSLRRHHFGLRYPRVMGFISNNSDSPTDGHGATLDVRHKHVIDSSFFYLRFAGDATLDLGDGRTMHAPIITEHLAPGTLQWRSLWWLINMRIGRNGRGAFLP